MDSNPNLRIHVEEDLIREERLKQRLHACLPEAKSLADQFESTTGWLLNYTAAAAPGDLMADQTPSPVFGRFEISDMSAKWPAGKPTVSRAESDKLVSIINRLVNRIERLESLQHQSSGTLIEANEDSPLIPTNLSDKVANLLRFAKQELGALGAAVYLLDENTTHLRLRSMIAPVPFAPEVESVRSLEHSLADLESLIGNKVNIHSREMGETWKIPKPFQFGWCVVLGTKNLPLGTIWLFFSEARTPSTKELDFIESLNNQLYSEINSREKPQTDPATDLLKQELLLAARSNDARLPSFAPEIDSWKISGWTYRHGYLASTFHDWAVTPSGNLSVALGQVSGPMLTAAMSLNNLRSLVSAHRDYRHSSQSMAAKLNEQIWCQSPGDETAALIYVLVEPESNRVSLVNAGDGGVVFCGTKGVQSIDQFQAPLGMDLESDYVQWDQVLKESDTLVLFSQGLRHAISESMPSANDADLLRSILLTHPGQPHSILAAIEERFFNSDFQHVAGDLSVIVLARNSRAPDVHQVAAEVSKSILAELRAEEGDLLDVLVKRIEQPDDWDEHFDGDEEAEIDAEEFDEHWSHDDSTLGVIDADDDTAAEDLPVASPPSTSPTRKEKAKREPRPKAKLTKKSPAKTVRKPRATKSTAATQKSVGKSKGPTSKSNAPGAKSQAPTRQPKGPSTKRQATSATSRVAATRSTARIANETAKLQPQTTASKNKRSKAKQSAPAKATSAATAKVPSNVTAKRTTTPPAKTSSKAPAKVSSKTSGKASNKAQVKSKAKTAAAAAKVTSKLISQAADVAPVPKPSRASKKPKI
jgi:serine phosphatase RsbU (regulator of sigma subunit)